MKTVCAYLHDGLGNQCFIYAAAKALALRANADLQLNVDCLQNDVFGRKFALGPFAGIPVPMPTSSEIVRKMAFARTILATRFGVGTKTCPCEPEPARYCPFPTEWHGRLVLRLGYWQSERYFEDFRDEILRDFRLKDDAWLKSDALARRIEATENSIFLHVRTYREVPGNEDGRGAFRMRDYYRNALAFLAARLTSATVFVFSDDVDWARRNVLTDDLLAGLPFEFVSDTGGGGSSGLHADAPLPARHCRGQFIFVVGGVAWRARASCARRGRLAPPCRSPCDERRLLARTLGGGEGGITCHRSACEVDVKNP